MFTLATNLLFTLLLGSLSSIYAAAEAPASDGGGGTSAATGTASIYDDMATRAAKGSPAAARFFMETVLKQDNIAAVKSYFDAGGTIGDVGIEHEEIIGTPLHGVRSVGMAKIFIDHGVPVDRPDSLGRTPLMVLVQTTWRWQASHIPLLDRWLRARSLVDFFLLNGASLNPTENQESALHAAAYGDNYFAANYLLSLNDASGQRQIHNINHRNQDGKTALDIAYTMRRQAQNSVVVDEERGNAGRPERLNLIIQILTAAGVERSRCCSLS